MRTRPCTAEVRRGRLRKTEQFLEAANLIRDLAGIAAADVICCTSLGEHAQVENHDEAIGLLTKADKDAAKHLNTLLKLKTRSA